MKSLKELTLLDEFLFDQTMDILEAQEAILQIILSDDKLRLLLPPQTEKELRTAPWLRAVRLDVFSIDEERTMYNTEMQATWRKDLVKRSRFYQSMIDSSLLEPGVENFNQMNNTCIIMITPFDLFGEDKYCYTFRSFCVENKDLALPDGTVRIFLNTRGKNDSEVSKELRDFLHYVECVDGDFAEQTGSQKIQKLHGYISRIKASEEIGVKYMQRWEEKLIDRRMGRREGREEGKELAIIQKVCKKLVKGKSPEAISEELEEELPKILRICDAAREFAPDYDYELIFKKLNPLDPESDEGLLSLYLHEE